MKIRDRIRELRRVPASDLRPNPKNWRTHPEAQANALKGLLAEVGIADAVLARELPDGSLMLLDGHLRAETLGEEMVPVLVLDVDEAEGDKVLATLDPLAAMAEADAAKLDAILREVDTGSPDVQQLLADLADEAGLYQDDAKEIVEDEVPEPPADPITKPGDLWVLGEHRLLCGDSTKPEDVERLMAGARFAICFTSPPYSDMREYKDGVDVAVTKLRGFIPAFARHGDYLAVNLGIKRKNGEIDEYWQDYISAGREAGTKLLSWNVWNREECGFSVGAITAMFAIQHEFVFVFGRSPKTLNLTVPNKEAGILNTHIGQRQADGTTEKQPDVVIRSHRQLGTIHTIGTQLARNENIDHPAMMPVALPAAYIEAMSDNGEIVAEPFCGSGTTLIAAEQLGRKCYGMEISPQYCDVIVKRWETLTGKKATREDE